MGNIPTLTEHHLLEVDPQMRGYLFRMQVTHENLQPAEQENRH